MEFFDALVRYETALWNAVEHELAQADRIGLGTLHALRVVARHEGAARVQELSVDIGITVGAASKFADRLERSGLIRRTPHPDDRRSSLIVLTPAGRRALDSGAEVCSAAVERWTAAEDLATLTAGLRRLQAVLDESATRSSEVAA